MRKHTWARQLWQVSTLAATAINVSLVTSPISALLPTMRHDLRLSAAIGGLLATIPLLSMGALGHIAPRLVRRLGIERVIALGLAVLTAGMLLRAVPSIVALFGGTMLASASVFGMVLVPAIIKRRFHQRAGVVIGIFSAAGLAGSVLGAAATVPLMRVVGESWRSALGLWAIVPAVTLAAWFAYMSSTTASDPRAPLFPHQEKERHLYRDRLAWQVALYYGIQNLVYNATAAWIPSLFVTHGLSLTDAGLLLAIVNIAGMAATLSVPVLAARHSTQGRLVVAAVALLAISLIGLLVAPVTGDLAWMIGFGLGQGAAFGLGNILILLRSADAQDTTELSGMTQSLGFVFSALGPVGLGIGYDFTGGWTWPLIVLLVLLFPMLVLGLRASRDRHVLVHH